MLGLARWFNRKPTVADVAEKLLTSLRALKPAAAFEYDAAAEVIRSDGRVIGLTNILHEYNLVPRKDREALIARHAVNLMTRAMPTGYDEVRLNLLPALRSLVALDGARINADISDLSMLTSAMRPFAPDVMSALVFDTPEAMQSVSASQLQQWGVEESEAHAQALDNLRARSEPNFVEVRPGLFLSNYADCYDAARILLPELGFQLGLTGALVAMVPNRDCLLLANDRNVDALLGMIAYADDVLRNQTRHLCADMFRLEQGVWTPWTPTQPPIASALAFLRVCKLDGDYRGQKAALDAAHQRSGADVFVASHTLMQRQDGRTFSYAALTKGVLTWLPRTDLLVLVDPEQPQRAKPVEWEAFVREAGHLLKPLGCVPARFLVESFPEQEIVDRLPQASFA